ncbi:MAG: acetyl-CoA acetyltransferase [Ruminococcaceae bacterium]|nr:acetyl-CoA acetyltransferase [Oscillospiraceae bacterium]
MAGLKDKVCVIGMGCSKFGEFFNKSREDLILEAVNEALEDAGLQIEDIDAFWFGSYYEYYGYTISTVLKTQYKPVTRVENNCCTGAEAFRNACYGVTSGEYKVVMAIGLEKLKDNGFSGNPDSPAYRDGTKPTYGGPGGFSLLVPAYCEKYGVSFGDIRDAMATVAWKNHRNGARNPKAMYRKEMTKEAILRSPMVCEPYISVMDCSGVSDGCACAILTSSEDAKYYRPDPMYVKCTEIAAASGFGTFSTEYDYTTVKETVHCARNAYRKAGITDPAKQLSLVELHDCFTITEIVLYEDLMLSERGQGWRDCLEGKFLPEGQIPVNIDGGLKSFGHPVGASGIRMLYESWLQFHGRAGERQLENPTLGLAHNLGGYPWENISSVTIVGKNPG